MKPAVVLCLLTIALIMPTANADNTVKQTVKKVFSDIKTGTKKVASDVQEGACKKGIPCHKETIKRNFKNAVKDLKAQ